MPTYKTTWIASFEYWDLLLSYISIYKQGTIVLHLIMFLEPVYCCILCLCTNNIQQFMCNMISVTMLDAYQRISSYPLLNLCVVNCLACEQKYSNKVTLYFHIIQCHSLAPQLHTIHNRQPSCTPLHWNTKWQKIIQS